MWKKAWNSKLLRKRNTRRKSEPFSFFHTLVFQSLLGVWYCRLLILQDVAVLSCLHFLFSWTGCCKVAWDCLISFAYSCWEKNFGGSKIFYWKDGRNWWFGCCGYAREVFSFISSTIYLLFSLLLSVVSGAVPQDRMDRTVLSPWLRFQWDTYRNCLDLLRNNVYVEQIYHHIARQSFAFCLQYQRRNEFRKLSDMLRFAQNFEFLHLIF